jgi:hypothetical protein
MTSTRGLYFISSSILLVFIAISFYYGIFSPPPLITYTTDENFIGDSGILMLYGNTPRNLEWAALPSTFIAYLFFLIWCTFSIISQFSSLHGLTDILSIIDKEAFYFLTHREEFIFWERSIQIILVGVIVFKTVQFITHSKHNALNDEIKTILSILCVCSNILWVSVPLIRPEALAGSLFLLVTIKILFSENLNPKVATLILILFTLTITQRLIFLFMSPFILGGIILHFWKQNIHWKVYRNYLGIVVLAIFATMPFLITNTLVIFKSFIGGVFFKMNNEPMDTFFNMAYIHVFLKNPSNIIFTLISIVGAWFIIKRYNSKPLIFLFLGNLIFFLFNSLKATQLYVTHTFPISIMTIILIAFGLGGVLELMKNEKKKWSLIMLLIILLVNSFYSIRKENADIKQQQQNLADAIDWVESLKNNEKIALELDFEGFIQKNKATLIREYQANKSEKFRTNKLRTLLKLPKGDSLSNLSLPIIAQSFAFEDERLLDTEYQITLKYIDTDKRKHFDTDYFYENNNMMSHCLVKQDAISRFEKGEYHYLISKNQLENKIPIKKFLKPGGSGFWVYENQDFKN